VPTKTYLLRFLSHYPTGRRGLGVSAQKLLRERVACFARYAGCLAHGGRHVEETFLEGSHRGDSSAAAPRSTTPSQTTRGRGVTGIWLRGGELRFAFLNCRWAAVCGGCLPRQAILLLFIEISTPACCSLCSRQTTLSLFCARENLR
jgi:hypothetical protein